MSQIKDKLKEFHKAHLEIALLCADEERLFTNEQKGLTGLIKFISFHMDLRNCCLYDKIIGLSAAYLIIGLGIKDVFCDVITPEAISLFDKYKVNYEYEEKVDYIYENNNPDKECREDILARKGSNPVEVLKIIQDYYKAIGVKYL